VDYIRPAKVGRGQGGSPPPMPTQPSGEAGLGRGRNTQSKIVAQKKLVTKNINKGRYKMNCLNCEELVTVAKYELANSAEIVGYACSEECQENLYYHWSIGE